MDTSTAGSSKSDGSDTASPVSGFIPVGKSSNSGPYVIGESGVDVGDGTIVDVDILLGLFISVAVGWITCGPEQAERVAKMSSNFVQRIGLL